MRIFIPTAAMQKCGEEALNLRKQYKRGMTPVGIARAAQLKNQKPLSEKTVRRMYSYFKRHEVDKSAKTWSTGHSDGGPSNGYIAWQGWGGDPGYKWVTKIIERLDK